MWNDLRGVVVDFRMRHSEWSEDPLLHEGGEGLVAHHLNDLRQEHVVNVSVRPLRSRSKLQMVGPECGCDRFVAREVVERHPGVSAGPGQVGVFVQSAGHIHQMLDPQSSAVLGCFRDVGGYGIGEGDLPFEDQERNRGTGKLLGQ